jgi:hypothetical protein
MDVFEICRNVRSEVKERLDSELTLEEAREALQKVYVDLEIVTNYSVRRKRKKDSGEGKKRKKKKKSSNKGAGSSQA